MYQAPLWQPAPFLRLLPPFVGGLWLAAQKALPPLPILIALSSALFVVALSTKFHPAYRYRWVTGLAVHLVLVLTGMHIFFQNQWPPKKDWLGRRDQPVLAYIGSPETIVLPTEKTNRQVFRIHYLIDSQYQVIACSGKIQVATAKADSLHPLPGENWLVAAAPVKPIQPDLHPGAFNYANYAARQHLYHQGYFSAHQLTRIQPAGRLQLSAFFARCQLSAIAAMRAGIAPKEQALAMALLIGYRQEMDKDLLQAYNDTGTVHVIAVSGMHLGLLFLLLQALMRWPIKGNWFKWTRAFLILLMIFWFSAVAGGAPSILRAALMFGFASLGKLLFKPMHALQSLGFTAFCMLLVEPNWCWDAGFQLSFAALSSIVIFQPLIANKIDVRNPLLKHIWELTAVTLAAQVLTFPLSVYLFHQAPLYFLISNLVAVPLSSFALVSGLLQWGVHAAGIPLFFFGQATTLLLQWMNAGIEHVRQLPGSVLRDLEWSIPMVLAVYGCITAAGIWLTQPSKQALFGVLATLLLLLTIHTVENFQVQKQGYLLVYQQPGAQMIDLIRGDTVYEIGASPEKSLLRKNAQRFFHIKNRIVLGHQNLLIDNMYIRLQTSPIANDPPTGSAFSQAPTRHQLTLLLLSPETPLPHDSLALPATLVLADGSLSRATAMRWEAVCSRFQQPFHNGWKAGPLLLKLNIKRNFAPP